MKKHLAGISLVVALLVLLLVLFGTAQAMPSAKRKTRTMTPIVWTLEPGATRPPLATKTKTPTASAVVCSSRVCVLKRTITPPKRGNYP